MSLRTITMAVCLVDALVWACVTLATFWSGSDPATKGLDWAAGMAVTCVFVLTGIPALVLTGVRRAARTALTLAFAFPALLGLLLVAAIVALHV